jgi:hypothetical protein
MTGVVVDPDGIYDPVVISDHLLRGLKGTTSDFELTCSGSAPFRRFTTRTGAFRLEVARVGDAVIREILQAVSGNTVAVAMKSADSLLNGLCPPWADNLSVRRKPVDQTFASDRTHSHRIISRS